jgi:hypothetical protein
MSITSLFKKDVQELSSKSKKEDSMLETIIRLGKWRGLGIGLFYLLVSLILFSYGAYSLIRYKETTGIVRACDINPKALQTFFGTNINSYQTLIEFPVSDTSFHQDTVSTSIQYPVGSELTIIYDTRTLKVQISNNRYSWLALVIGLIGILGSVAYMTLSWRSRAFQTTVGLYGKLF